MSSGFAVRPHGRAIPGTRTRVPRQPIQRKNEKVSVTIVLFFILASTLIAFYDLALLYKLLW